MELNSILREGAQKEKEKGGFLDEHRPASTFVFFGFEIAEKPSI